MSEPAPIDEKTREELISAITRKVLNMLQKQDFADWYSDSGRFGAWLTGDSDIMQKEFGSASLLECETHLQSDLKEMLGFCN